MNDLRMHDIIKPYFPLCTVVIARDGLDNGVDIYVSDSGGLVAHAQISRVSLAFCAYRAVGDAIRRLADVFETPSHWMAL